MTFFAVTSLSSFFYPASTCLRIGSRLCCTRSTPTERQSIYDKDFECLASTGVKAPGTMFPYSGCPAKLTSHKPTSGPRTFFPPRPLGL